MAFKNTILTVCDPYLHSCTILTDFCCTLADNWWSDQHRWVNNGQHKLRKKRPQLLKTYFLVDTPSGSSHAFQRHAYQLLHNDVTLVHYVGDDSGPVLSPHGLSSTSDAHIRTCSSVIACSKANHSQSNRIYVDMCTESCPPELQSVLKPRNVTQLKNVVAATNSNTRLIHDALYNVYEVAYKLVPYVRIIQTYPDLVLVFGHEQLLRERDLLLQSYPLHLQNTRFTPFLRCYLQPGRLLSFNLHLQTDNVPPATDNSNSRHFA